MNPAAALVVLLLLMASSAPPTSQPVGRFSAWLSSRETPVRFVSGGVSVAIDPLPCGPETMIGDSTCRYDGYNNQARVTITAPGVAPVAVLTDRQAEYARVAVVRLDRRDPRPAMVIDSDSGGSAGNSWITVVVPTAVGYRAVDLTMRLGTRTSRDLQGEIADFPRDVSGDGIVDFVMEDPRFAYTFGCGACTPRPPVILSVIGGRAVDLSADPSVRRVFALDMAKLGPRCVAADDRDRNGACAAYVADAARAGRFGEAWRVMLAHYDRHPPTSDLWQSCLPPRDVRGACPPRASTRYTSFPESLRAFLIETGYITPADAARIARS